MMKILLADAAATNNLGVTLGKILPAGSVILLEGDLGAGKTTFVQGLGKGLGITESIVSPTFTLINEYTQGRLDLYHLDLYRLTGNEIEALNLETYWEGMELPLGIVAIEWAEKMLYKPDRYLKINLTYETEGGRYAEITPHNCELSDAIASLSILSAENGTEMR